MEIPSEDERRQLVIQGAGWVARWLQLTEPNDKVIYHEGWLMSDRLNDPEIDAIAKAFLAATEKGLVELKQRKINETTFEYIAQRRAG